ncbi:MAG: fibronectin type III domain-containing protein [Thermoplasmatota archaeon]
MAALVPTALPLTAVGLAVASTAAPLPPVPVGLAATANGLPAVNLSWNASAQANVTYNLYRGAAGAPLSRYLVRARVSSTGPGRVLFGDGDVNWATTYTYAVTSVLDGNESNQSSPVVVMTPPAPAAPPAPANLSATTQGSGAIQLAWSLVPAIGPNHPYAWDYRILRGLSPGNETPLATLLGALPSYTDIFAANGTRYFYTIEAFAANVSGPPSAEVSAVGGGDHFPPPPPPLPQPQGGCNAAVINDCFGNATTIAALPYETAQSTIGARTQAGERSPCGPMGSTVWYAFTPSEPGILTVSTIGGVTNFDTIVAIYAGPSLANSTMLGCNDDSNFTRQSEVAVGVQAGVEYHIQVGGFMAATGNLTLRAWEIPAPPSPPAAPENLVVATGVTSDSYEATLAWYEPGTNHTGAYAVRYSIWRSESNGSGTLAFLDVAGPRFVDDTIQPNITYEYSVRAYFILAGFQGPLSAASDTVYARVTPPPPPEAPLNVTTVAYPAAHPPQVSISWDPSSPTFPGAVVSYQILRSNGTGPEKIISVPQAGQGARTRYADLDVAGGALYQYRIVAIEGEPEGTYGQSAPSAPSTVLGLVPPSPPQDATAVAECSNAVRLVWNASEMGPAQHYDIFQYEPVRGASGVHASSRYIASTNETTFVVRGLEPGGSFRFYVVAWNGPPSWPGRSAPSSDASAVTPFLEDRCAGGPRLVARPGDLGTLGAVELSWQTPVGFPSSEAHSYLVVYRLNAHDAPMPIAWVDHPSPSGNFTYNAASEGDPIGSSLRSWSFVVIAHDSSGFYPTSDVACSVPSPWYAGTAPPGYGCAQPAPVTGTDALGATSNGSGVFASNLVAQDVVASPLAPSGGGPVGGSFEIDLRSAATFASGNPAGGNATFAGSAASTFAGSALASASSDSGLSRASGQIVDGRGDSVAVSGSQGTAEEPTLQESAVVVG